VLPASVTPTAFSLESAKKRKSTDESKEGDSEVLDPVTKQFAKDLLDEEGLFESTRALLKEKHRDAWRSYNTPADSTNEEVVNTSNNEE